MSEDAIRTQIAAILSGVADIGKVYDYERWTANWSKFIQLFKVSVGGQQQIRGWEISRIAVNESLETLGGGSAATDSTHRYLLRGYMGLADEDATEKTFNALIETIRDAFRQNLRLNGTASWHKYIQVRKIEPRMFGNVLCHYAELELTVEEQF